MNKYINKKKAILLLIVLSVYVLIITPLLIVNLRKQQNLRSKADVITPTVINDSQVSISPTTQTNTSQPTTTFITSANQYQHAASCGNVPSDIVLIIDRSGSMVGTKLSEAKQAAKNFIDVIASDTGTQNRIGLVSFSSTATLDSPLTTNFSSVKSKIDALNSNGYTCHECAVAKANQEISTNGRAGVKKVVVMLTDGQTNYIIGGTAKVDTALAEKKALDSVTTGFNASKTVFFTIGFGLEGQTGNTGYNGQFLQKITVMTGGKYYYPAPGELQAVYNEISLLIGKGLLGGFIFNDINGNGVYDLNEPKLNGWQVQLTSSAGTQTFTADATGTFTVTGLCDGSYTLKQILRSGWVQTLPSSTSGYSVAISNGNSFTDKNFGNKIAPTPTPTNTPAPTSTPIPTKTPTPTPTPKPKCSDGIDNDNNGYTDSKDSSCHTDGNPDNPNSYDPNKNGENGGGNTCADSKDNNNNGLIDGADPVCHTDKNANNPASYDPNLPEVTPPTLTLTPSPKPSATPTPTVNPTPANTFMSVTIYHHGVWNSGDNTNPTQTDLSNKNPLHPTIDANLELFNTNNQLIGQGHGPLKYNSKDGNFQGVVGIYPNTFPSGNYYLKIKTNYHLKKLVTGILTIKAEQTNTIPAATLVAGDANDDNKLSILDYNILLDCYSDLTHAAACNADKKVTSDFNDDSFVNQIDYNLFLREIATQPGQ